MMSRLSSWHTGLVLLILALPWLLLVLYSADQVMQRPLLWADWLAYPGLLTMVIQSLQISGAILLIAWLLLLSVKPLSKTNGWLVQIIGLPHLAFAVGLLWLFAPYGWLWRLLPTSLQLDWFDRQQLLSFIIILAVKEIPFLWLMSQRALAQMPWQRWLLVGQSLGYSRQHSWWLLVLPELFRRLRIPIIIVVVYGLSVVDVALIAAPQTPPPLAVQVLQWQLDAQPSSQQFAAYGALVLLLLALVTALSVISVERFTVAQLLPRLGSLQLKLPWAPIISGLGALVAVAIIAQSVAVGWFYPELLPTSWQLTRWHQELPNILTLFAQSAGIAILVASLSVLWVVLLLEWQRRRRIPGLSGWLIAPLLVPQLTLMLAWFGGLAEFTQGGRWSYLMALVLVQIPFSAAYAYLILAPAERRFEQRYITTLQSFGYGFWRSWWVTKSKLLLNPLLLAWVFAALVSMAQYLPIIFYGGGRWPTLTSELVAISSGANSQLMAIYAVSQWLLALVFLAVLSWQQPQFDGEQQ